MTKRCEEHEGHEDKKMKKGWSANKKETIISKFSTEWQQICIELWMWHQNTYHSIWTSLNTGATNNVYIPKKVRFITLAHTVALNGYSQTSQRIPHCVISNTRQRSLGRGLVYVHNIMPERMSKNQVHFYVFACS